MNQVINLVLFAGGEGTRMQSKKTKIPKGLTKILSKPLIWHVISSLKYQFKLDIILCTGFLQQKYIQYFDRNFDKLNVEKKLETFDVKKYKFSKNINIYILPTGKLSTTVERFFKANKFLDCKISLKKDEKARVFSYGDTVMDIDLSKLIKIHKKNRNLVTATSYLAKYEYGLFEINDEIIINFYEKQFPKFFRINSGFFVVDRNSVSLFSRNAKNLDGYFLKKIIDKNKLGNYSHEGIWFPIDTIQQVKEYEKFIRANERTLYNDNL